MIHYPYWSCYDGLGRKYCDCSHEKYAIRTLELHEGEEVHDSVHHVGGHGGCVQGALA